MSRTAAFFGNPGLAKVQKAASMGWPYLEYQEDDKEGNGVKPRAEAQERPGPPTDRGQTPPPPPARSKRKDAHTHTQQPQKPPQNPGTQGRGPPMAAGDRNQLDNTIQKKKPSAKNPNHSWWS